MLTQLSITGFRCFRQLDVELKPLTVLIGQNDTGKSAFLDAIEFLGPADPWQFAPHDHFRGAIRETCAIRAVAKKGGNVRYEAELLTESGSHRFSRSTEGSFVEGAVQRFQLPGTGVVTECSGFDQKDGSWFRLTGDGSRVAALLDQLLRTDLSSFLALRDELRRYVPGFEDIKIETPQANLRRIDFLIEGGLRLPAQRASAGTRLLLFFLALVHHPVPPEIILLEEPETGIHPKRLGDVMELLRGITQGKFGKAPAQVILATHSPYLLDYVKPEEDQVLVFQRTDDGSRTARPVNWDRLKEFFDGFLPGEILFNEEEAGFVREAS